MKREANMKILKGKLAVSQVSLIKKYWILTAILCCKDSERNILRSSEFSNQATKATLRN